MAQAAAEIYAAEKNADILFNSAGVAVFPGSHHVNPYSAKALFNAYGIRFSHIPTQLTLELAEKYDIIVAMNDDIASYAHNVIGVDKNKLTVMPKRIPDPFGYSQTVYDECLKDIADGVSEIIDRIITDKNKEDIT